MKSFHLITESQRAQLCTARAYDTKIGEKVKLCPRDTSWSQWIQATSAEVIILGLCEDIGVRANYGREGTAGIWSVFLHAFCNMQSNVWLSGEETVILGAYEPKYVLSDTEQLSEAVSWIDNEVCELLQALVSTQKTLIIVGGGHNNAYPVIKTCARTYGPIAVLNIDAHADFRAKEGRHSGNGFRYAKDEGWLKKYALYGYHESYMPSYIYQDMHQDSDCWMRSYEEICLHTDQKHLSSALHFLGEVPMALELDIDALAYADASARTPEGFSLRETRMLIRQILSTHQPLYLHICEARAKEEEEVIAGKRIAYLVHDFLRYYKKSEKNR